jgi:CBS domain-containing protein
LTNSSRRSQQRYYAPGDLLVEPASGVATEIFFIRQGAVTGVRGMAELSGGAFQYEAGDLFPVSAAVAQRAVTASYRAVQDTFVLVLPVQAMRALAARSAAFADFLNGRVLKFLELSRRALQVAYSSQALAEQSLETPLGQLARTAPVTCGPDAPLRGVLQTMHGKRIGSMLVTDGQGQPAGHPHALRRAGPGGAGTGAAGGTRVAGDGAAGAQPDGGAHRAGRGAADVHPRHSSCAGHP